MMCEVSLSRNALPKISTWSLARISMPVPFGTPATMLPSGAKLSRVVLEHLVVEDARALAVHRQARAG